MTPIRYQRLALMLLLMACPAFLPAQSDAEEMLAEQYFRDGEYAQALPIYEQLYRKAATVQVTQRMVVCYEKLDQYEEATKLLERAIRREPDVLIYPALMADLLEKTGDFKAAEKLYQEIVSKKLTSREACIQLGAYFYQENKLDPALMVYRQGRKITRNEYEFCEEIGNLLQIKGDYEGATTEFLNIYYQNSEDLSAASISILNLITPASEATVERVLLLAVDKHQTDAGLRIILYEYYVMAKNFAEAFVQVKAIDKLFQEDGERIYQFSETMRNNKDYTLSNQALDYLIERKKGSPYYLQAHFDKALNNESRAFDQIPTDMAAVRQAIVDYGKLLDEFGRRAQYFNAIYRRAYLMVFYGDQIDQALVELEDITRSSQGLRQEDWARGRVLAGDILLMKKEYNKAKLVYTEVSDALKDRPQGAAARFKLAQMAYYRGEFSLAQAFLNGIKDNTSNDISNDAIRLNLLIIDNTGLDTTTKPLELFAQAQLLTYQRSYEEAIILLDSLAFTYPTHALADEILWEKTNISLSQHDVTTALTFIDQILNEFIYDIYGDDALYTKARIYDRTLSNPEEAMKHYLDFLVKFPGSLYAVEVRKRIRELRQG
ncbi:MAG: tetratricopeptide repeat protein [Bacteroidia bacterium]|nr:tetratricopeptide repeat protein [Bacteroidia bacterium]